MTTCEEMLRDRGYAVETLAESDDDKPVMRGSAHATLPDVDVYFHAEERVGVKFARAALEASPSCIIVSVEGPTPFTRKECSDSRVEFFCARELVYNVTKHSLVPAHERLAEPPDGTTRDTLPKMLDGDPIVRYYGWPVGTVVRVWRCFGGNEPIPYVRVVVGG